MEVVSMVMAAENIGCIPLNNNEGGCSRGKKGCSGLAEMLAGVVASLVSCAFVDTMCVYDELSADGVIAGLGIL